MYERTQIRERTRRGRYRKAREGKLVNGKVPYGYRRCADDRDRLEPHPEHAPVVRMIFSWIASEWVRRIG